MFLSVLATVGKILIAILAFGVMIFVHEGAHFLVARWCGIKVNEFAIGMGPKLFQIHGKKTLYTIRLFPVGGFCSMEGEDDTSEEPDAFPNKPVWKRICVVIAGAIMNILLGLLILVPLNAQEDLAGTNVIHSFTSDAVSNGTGGLQKGDKIKEINGYNILVSNDISFALLRDTDGKVDFVVERDGKDVSLSKVPFRVEEKDGIKYERLDFKIVGVPNTFWLTVKQSVLDTVSVVRQVVLSFFDLITGHVAMKQMAGPVGITQMITENISMDLRPFFSLVAMISINIGVFNLFPLPALDGGRLVFLIIEGIRRKPVPAKYEGLVHFIGLVLLLGLIVVITFSDIIRLATGG